MKPDEVAVPRSLIAALNDESTPYPGDERWTVVKAESLRTLLDAVSVDEGQSDTERPAEDECEHTLYVNTNRCTKCGVDLTPAALVPKTHGYPMPSSASISGQPLIDVKASGGQVTKHADPYAGVRKEAPDKDARIAELEGERDQATHHAIECEAKMDAACAELARYGEPLNEVYETDGVIIVRQNLHNLRAERDDALARVESLETIIDREGFVEAKLRAERDELADKVRALRDALANVVSECAEHTEPEVGCPICHAVALLSDPAPPAAQMPTTAGEWEERIQADFQKHPGSWRPDPENWFREGWLAGFDAGAER